MKKLGKKGFTIIEVLIASMVFTTVLLLCMEGITRIAKVYIKNASISKTNEFAKAFTEEITQQIKYGSSVPVYFKNSNNRLICVGGMAYVVKINRKIDDNQDVKKRRDDGCNNFKDNGFFDDPEAVSIAPPRSRILIFDFEEYVNNEIPVKYKLDIRIALGDGDLMVDNSGKNANEDDVILDQLKCKSGIAGSEFCSVITLTTVATRRIR